MTYEVRGADDRFVTHGDGWVGYFAFSYGEHYDAANIRFGPLLACNEFILEPGAGFEAHRHVGVDVVTFVLEGALEHFEPSGTAVRLPGEPYLMRAAHGVEHAERNASSEEPVRFIQAWLTPGLADPLPTVVRLEPGLAPRDPSVGNGVPHWTFEGPNQPMGFPIAPWASAVYVHVTEGQVTVAGSNLCAGDSARITGKVPAVTATESSELLVWALSTP